MKTTLKVSAALVSLFALSTACERGDRTTMSDTGMTSTAGTISMDQRTTGGSTDPMDRSTGGSTTEDQRTNPSRMGERMGAPEGATNEDFKRQQGTTPDNP